MRGTSKAACLSILVLLVVPLAQADWGGRGFVEPDHERDRLEGLMFADADQSSDAGVKQVYFSTYAVHFQAGVNPNLGALGGAVMAYPTSLHAFLGVWKDCNRDGYIGTSETALLEYRTELLLDSSVCPVGTSPHNDGDWVMEFRWIGPDTAARCEDPDFVEDDGENDDDPYNIVDDCARMWADFGLPEQAGTASCPVNPRPRGTYQSTGGFLRFVDCLDGWRITGAVNTVADATEADETLGIQLAFHDAPQSRPDQSGSILNQRNPYGHESDASYAKVWDCSATPTHFYDPTAPAEGQPGMLRTIGVRDPTDTPALDELENNQGYLGASVNVSDPDGRLLTLHNVGLGGVNPGGSGAGTTNETLEGAPSVGVFGNTLYGDSPEDRPDCDRSDGGHGADWDLYDLEEADFEATGAKRVQTDFYMSYRETGARGGRFTGFTSVDDMTDGALGPAMPEFAGIGLALRDANVLTVPTWYGDPGYVASRNPYINRDTFEPWGIVETTAYAKVSESVITAEGLTMPAGGATLVYGAPHCNGETPITHAWDCNAEKWWRGPAGEDIRTVWQVVVGQEYNLRDIDCWDGTVARGQPGTGTAVGKSCSR
jgi:hypothetical protein